jgi:hypothetical protein
MADKYVVYVDESGEASTAAVDKAYPVFVLACCVFDVDTYINEIVPGFQKLKFDWFGHDQVIFHSSDIRRRRGDFQFLADPAAEMRFSSKASLSTGLQIADLIARPIGLNSLGRGIVNAPFEILREKLR